MIRLDFKQKIYLSKSEFLNKNVTFNDPLIHTSLNVRNALHIVIIQIFIKIRLMMKVPKEKS